MAINHCGSWWGTIPPSTEDQPSVTFNTTPLGVWDDYGKWAISFYTPNHSHLCKCPYKVPKRY